MQTAHPLVFLVMIYKLSGHIDSDLSNIKMWSEDWLITFNLDKTDIIMILHDKEI